MLLKGGIGNRDKTARALVPTPGLVDASRFRTGAVRATLFLTAEKVRGIIAYPSCAEARGRVPDCSARISRRGERMCWTRRQPGVTNVDGGRLSAADFRFLVSSFVDHSHATNASSSSTSSAFPPSDLLDCDDHCYSGRDKFVVETNVSETACRPGACILFRWFTLRKG